MGKHAQSRSRHTAWSYRRLLPASESNRKCRTAMGSGLYFCLFDRNAFILYQFYVVSRYASGQNERATPQIRPRSHLSSHSGHIHTPSHYSFCVRQAVGGGVFSPSSGCRLSPVSFWVSKSWKNTVIWKRAVMWPWEPVFWSLWSL